MFSSAKRSQQNLPSRERTFQDCCVHVLRSAFLKIAVYTGPDQLADIVEALCLTWRFKDNDDYNEDDDTLVCKWCLIFLFSPSVIFLWIFERGTAFFKGATPSFVYFEKN